MINPSIYLSLSLYQSLKSICLYYYFGCRLLIWYSDQIWLHYKPKKMIHWSQRVFGQFHHIRSQRAMQNFKNRFYLLVYWPIFLKIWIFQKSIAQIFVQILNLNKRLSLALTFLLPQINKSPYGPWVAVRVFHILYISIWNLWYSFSSFLEFQPNG